MPLLQTPVRCRARATFRRGFSLIELTVVLVLTALLAGLVVVSLTGSLRSARLADAVDAVRRFDALARSSARQSGRPVTLQFEPASQSLSMLRQDLPAPTRLTATSSFRVLRLRTDSGDQEITLSPGGTSSTYAVEIYSGAQRTWIVFSGLTGVSVLADEPAVASYLAGGGQ